MNRIVITIGFALLAASACPGQERESSWDRAFHDALSDKAAVVEIIRRAGESPDPAAIRFLEARALGWPHGAYARPALVALGRNPAAGYIDFVSGIADRARRDPDKIAALEFLESAPAHRTAALPRLLALLRRHHADPFGEGLLGILQRYLLRPLDPQARGAILDAFLDIYTDEEQRFLARHAWDATRGFALRERLPFLVHALESMDSRCALEAATALLDGRVGGAEDLLVECLVRRPAAASRAALWDVLGQAKREVLWIKVLERVGDLDWGDLGHVREALTGCDAAPVGPLLMGALQERTEAKLAVLALHWMRDRRVVSAMPQVRAALLRSDDPRIKILAADVMCELSDDGDWWRRAQRYIESGGETTRLDRIDALIDLGLKSPRVRGWLRERLGRRQKWEVLAHLIQAAGAAGFRDVTKHVERFLDHDRWQVRLATIECLVASGQRRALPRLAAVTGDERHRLARAAADGLHRLTGQRFGTDPDDWRRHISRLPAHWKPLGLPAPETGGARDVRYGPSFYGLDLRSNRVVFVCDLSGSMAGLKLETLKRELISAVATINKPGGFNLVFFSKDVEPVWPRLALGVPRMKKKAAERVAQLVANGGTDVWGGLELALQDREADTIVLLTDGQPSQGRYREPADILRQTRRLNRSRRMQIHTIFVHTPEDAYPLPRVVNGLDESAAREFLERLAAHNQGLHKFARSSRRPESE